MSLRHVDASNEARQRMPCGNCGADRPTDRYQVHLATDEVVELRLCEECRERFETADWVELVV